MGRRFTVAHGTTTMHRNPIKILKSSFKSRESIKKKEHGPYSVRRGFSHTVCRNMASRLGLYPLNVDIFLQISLFEYIYLYLKYRYLYLKCRNPYLVIKDI